MRAQSRPRAWSAARNSAAGQRQHRDGRQHADNSRVARPVGSSVPADAPILPDLRAAGAIILGKANLGGMGQLPRVRQCFHPGLRLAGARVEDFTQNPYIPELTVMRFELRLGAAGAAANLCAAAIGTETEVRSVRPASNNIFGLKPTLGLFPRTASFRSVINRTLLVRWGGP